jgi:TetR/AcrR family transcriptional repressor of bet genes
LIDPGNRKHRRHAVGAIGTDILHRHADESLRQRVAAMFAPGALRTTDDLSLWNELVALSTRDPAVRQRLHDLWTHRWLPDLEAQLADEYPGASPDAAAATAYALACLFEAHWAFSVPGVVDTRRQRQAQRAALLLLDHLETG